MITKSTKKNSKEKNTRKKFKLPNALTIIGGVILFAMLITWIVHFVDPSSSWESQQFAFDSLGDVNTWLDDNKDGVVKDFINQNPDLINDWLSLNFIKKISGSSSDFYHFTDLGFQMIVKPFSDGNLIANDWFNFGGSNWYVSSNGMYGIFDLFKAGLAGVFDSFSVVFYIFAIGAFVELLLVTGSLEAGVGSLVKGLKGKEIILIPALFILFSLGGTLFGMQEETLGLIPVIVPVLILAGFDAATAYMVIVLGTTTGIAASVLDPFSIGVMAGALNTDALPVTIGTGIVLRMILFFIYTSIGTAFVIWYARRVHKNNDKSLETSEMIEKNKIWAVETLGNVDEAESLNKKQSWSLIVFGLTFAWMIFTLLPWLEWIPSLSNSPVWEGVSSLFFNNVKLGEWYFIELSILFIFSILIVGKIFGMTIGKIWEHSLRGMKGMIGVALILAGSRTVGIILNYSGATVTMVNSLFGGIVDTSPLMLVALMFPLLAFMAVFIPSTSGLAGITGPIISGIISNLDPANAKIAIIGIMALYPLAQGVINMWCPTTGLVITQAESSHTDYGRVMPYTLSYAIVISLVGLSVTLISLSIM